MTTWMTSEDIGCSSTNERLHSVGRSKNSNGCYQTLCETDITEESKALELSDPGNGRIQPENR